MPGMLERRWADFGFCEDGGEPIGSVQKRNIEALTEVLTACRDKNIVIGTHGTALSAILNFYDSGFGCDDSHWMHYVVRLNFDGIRYVGKEELLAIERRL